MSPVKCPKCGHELTEKESCSKCGFNLLESQTTASLISHPQVEAKEEFEVGPIQDNEEAVLVIKKGPVIGQRIALTEGEFTIGRDPKCDVFLNDITVSRKHAKLIYKSEGAEVKDIGSLNGTYVNNKQTDEAKLRNGDEIQIGKFVLVFLAK